MGGRLSVVVGGQAGSEAKGHVTAWLVRRSEHRHVINVRVAGPNAGHSAVGMLEGDTWALRSVPVGAVTNLTAKLLIAAGSEIDMDVLADEVARLDAAGYGVSNRLFVDAQATILEPRHQQAEANEGLVERIGSTGKGIGAARVDRVLRIARVAGDLRHEFGRMGHGGVLVQDDTGEDLHDALQSDDSHVVVEGTQGWALGLHAGFYPQCTSSDCRAIDFLAMAGISPWGRVPQPDIWVVVRPYPIRVAGNSGPLPGETTWQELGLPEELTTVTKKVRRVGEFDPEWVRKAVLANGGDVHLAFSMADQVIPALAGMSGTYEDFPVELGAGVELQEWINTLVKAAGDSSTVDWIGTGPGTSLFNQEAIAR